MWVIILLSLTAVVWLLALLDASLGFRKLERLENETALEKGPLVSIIIAARNEEDHIVESVTSQLHQTYQPLEWILINDRSTDSTGTKMESIQDPRVKVIHIESLPPEWLGKNHALYIGSKEANGDYLLFSDADVIFHPSALAKAMAYTKRHQLDHLTIAPNLHGNSFWLKSFVAFFLFGFSYFKRPWQANNPRSKIGMGIGAFNLVRRQTYQQIGTHESIKMRPDDDLMLGMRLKQQSYKQKIVTALSLVEVEWYKNVKEALVGLEKNTFAGLHYRLSMVVFAIVGVFVSQVLPFITLFTFNPIVSALSLLNIGLVAILYILITKRMTTFSPWLFVVFPLTALLFIYTIARASFLTFKRGGIMWRGTLYRLKDLRKNQA